MAQAEWQKNLKKYFGDFIQDKRIKEWLKKD